MLGKLDFSRARKLAVSESASVVLVEIAFCDTITLTPGVDVTPGKSQLFPIP